MEDNDINDLLERNGARKGGHFLRSSRDRDVFYDDQSDTSSKQRYHSSMRKTIKKTYESAVTTQGPHNLREFSTRSGRARSETPIDTEQKRFQQSEQSHRHHTVVNGASAPGDERVKRHVRRESSRGVNTSDYSSDEGRGADNLKGTAFPLYKQAGDWWDVFPKTDYTYSPVSPNRKEIVPGIIPMPNMSRRSIHSDSSCSEFNSRFSPSSNKNISYAYSCTSWFGNKSSGNVVTRRRGLYAESDSDADEVDVRRAERSSVKSSHVSTLTRILISVWTFLAHITSSVSQTVRRILHLDGSQIQRQYHFADIDSDDDEFYHIRESRTSVEKTFIVTRFLSSVFTSVYEIGCRVFKPAGSHEAHRRTTEATQSSWLQRLGSFRYWTACITRILDSWFPNLFSRQNTNSNSQQDERASCWKYLLFLLIPALIFAAWWWFSSDNVAAENPVITLVDSSSSNLNTLWLLPFSFGSLWGSEKVSITAGEDDSNPGREYSVNLELLVQKIIGREDFQNLVLSEALKRDQKRREAEEQILLTLQNQKEILEQALNDKNEMLSRQQELHAKLVEDVALLKQQVDQLEIQLLSSREDGQVPVIDSSQGLWRREIRRLEDRIRLLEVSHSTRPCCKVPPQPLPTVAIEEHVIKFLSGLFNSDGEAESKIPGIQMWLERLFVAKEDLESKLANISSTINMEVGEASRRSAHAIMGRISDQIKYEYVKQQAELNAKISEEKRNWVLPVASLGDNCSLTVNQVQDIVNNALNTYDADKTGMVDYALESSGGSIINTRCTDTYNARTATLSLLGVPLWWPSSNPRTVIQTGVSPGECWAFRGAQGYLVIRLSGRVKISAFSIEHIPISLAPNGRIDSAPKDFSVWGLKNESDKDPEMLGRYTYRDNATSLQIFSVQRTDLPPYEIVELRIESNHGNLEYTCLYRFRVHGVLSKE